MNDPPVTHPTGITVEIVGINMGSQGHSCEQHEACGTILEEDSVVRFRRCQVVVNGKETSAIAAYLVSDGIDTCRVGYLPRHLVKHSKYYDGVLAQITELYGEDCDSPMKRRKFHHNRGCCVAALISCMDDKTIQEIKKEKRTVNPKDEGFPQAAKKLRLENSEDI